MEFVDTVSVVIEVEFSNEACESRIEDYQVFDFVNIKIYENKTTQQRRFFVASEKKMHRTSAENGEITK